MQKNIRKFRGFTLIELLVVIVIIGVLATISVSTFNGYIIKAEAIKIVSDLNAIEKSFKLMAINESFSKPFPIEIEVGLGANPTIASIVAAGKMGNVTNKQLESVLGDGVYQYDNEGDSYVYLYRDNCPGANSIGGANIVVLNVEETSEIIKEIDDIIDNGDGLFCGKIRIGRYGVNPYSFMYNLSDNQ